MAKKKSFSYWGRLEELRMTEKELCKKAGISMWTLGRFKKHRKSVRIPVLICLSYALDCSSEELLAVFY